MKKYLIFLAAFVLATGFNAFAGNSGQMIVKIERGENAKIINLLVANLQKTRTNIAIEDFNVGSSRVDLQACKLEYSIVSPK